MAQLQITFRGASAFAHRFADRLAAAGARVRWDAPQVPSWDLGGQTHVEALLDVEGDASDVERVVSRFREYYPRGHIVVRSR